MKRILFLAMSVMMALTIKAVNVGDYVYTKVAKYRITGADLVTNGQFTDGSTAGWTATDEANFPLAAVFGPSEEGGVAVQAGQTDLAAGMYQAVKIDMGGTYVVSFKVKGAVAGYTDHDLTGAATNYINAYFNTDGALGTKDGTTLLYGENGVGGGYQFSYNADDFVEVSFAVEAPQDGNIMIDFRGMAEGLIIKDVECHTAEEVYDDRIVEERIEYIRVFLRNPYFYDKAYYDELNSCVMGLNDIIDFGFEVSIEQMEKRMANLDAVWVQFAEANLSNVIELIPTKDGSANTGNNSANWMNWVSKWNKLSSDYKNQAPWSWSTDRWSHKTAAANRPLQIQWQRKVSGDWNNIATLTATLDPGTYYWGVTGQGGMMTLDKARWVRSWANENAATQLFFNGDTTEVFILNSARNTDYVFKFELAEAKEITLGIICNTNTVATDGFDVQFINPVLYKVLDGGLTPEEKAYLDAVAAQFEALQKCIDVANGYLSEANDTLPWGKEMLKVGVDEAQVRYDEWAAMTEDDILEWYWNDESLADTIMNNGVRFLNNCINQFIAMNEPLTDMPGAVNVAKDVLGQRIYSSSAKKADFADLIAASEELYDQMLESEYSEENAAALIAQKAALETMAEEFKAAINATTIVDIDFGTQDAPAYFNVIEGVNSYGELETYYTIEGNKGVMTFSDITGSYPYALGWGSATDETTGAVIATDSLGMLRVGNSEAVVEFSGAPIAESDIVNIKFDFYYGNLFKKNAGYMVLTAEGDTICGLFCSKYSGTDALNTFGVDYNGKINAVGSSAASNSAIAAENNKTQFDIVLDYGMKTMYCTTSGSKGTVTTETIALPELVPGKFIIYSDYNNADRRCWFDNLKVLHISTEEAGDTPNEFDTFPFTITAPQTPNADGRYEYKSKVYNVAKPVTSLRFTFKETFCPNGSGKGNPPFVALGEFYLYDENGEQIMLSAENFYTNAQEQSEGPIENLCDDDTYTFWHSDWHGNVQEYHYLEVTLPEGLDLTTFSFGWIDRGFNKQNIPLEVEVSSVSLNMPEPGCYYYITSAFDAFVEHQGVNMMMYANEYGEARWDYEDPSALSRCWEFEPAEYEEGYYLKNAATGMYLGAEYYMSSSLSMVTSKDETVPYVISSLDGDVVAIASSLDAGYKLHAMGHQNGMGSSGAICYWNAGVGTASAWRICKAEGYTLDTLVYAMTAQDVVAEPSSIVNIPIELKNSTAVTAFQFDLYLPEDIATVYDVVLNGYRATDSHRVAYSEQPDGALRVLVYSAEDKPFIGRSGVVADVVVGISSEASEWDYPIVLSNVRMVKTDVTEVLGTDYMATLTIVQGALMGDVNSDGQHTMGDVVMIVNALLEKEQYNFNAAVADINGDGQLTIVDVVSVVRFVLGYEPVAAARDMHREASMVAIEAGSLMAGNHGEILLPIYMASDADYTAFQMDVVLPEGLTLADATLGGRGKSSHTLSWSTLDNGATRIVAFAMDNATFKDNAEALAILTLKAEGALQEGAVINLTDGLFATASGAEDRAEDVALKVEDETTGVGTLLGGIRVSGAEGAVVVESATDAVLSIYTMTGQLVQQAEVKAGKSLIALPAGVYVVNNQKVVVK